MTDHRYHASQLHHVSSDRLLEDHTGPNTNNGLLPYISANALAGIFAANRENPIIATIKPKSVVVNPRR